MPGRLYVDLTQCFKAEISNKVSPLLQSSYMFTFSGNYSTLQLPKVSSCGEKMWRITLAQGTEFWNVCEVPYGDSPSVCPIEASPSEALTLPLCMLTVAALISLSMKSNDCWPLDTLAL